MSAAMCVEFLFAVAALLGSVSADVTPNQIRLAFTGNASEIAVSWNTNDSVAHPIVEWGPSSDPKTRVRTPASSHLFQEKSELKLTQYVHRGVLRPLTSGVNYAYRVGSSDEAAVWSPWIEFSAVPSSQPDGNFDLFSPTLAVFGDLGLENGQSVPRLIDDVNAGMYDAILHVGDFAYDMYENNGGTGDRFMRMIQPIASKVAYMTCPGNHENLDDFFQYRNRFQMPTRADDLFYSFTLGPARFISLSTEQYYYVFKYGFARIVAQYRWLEDTLKAAVADRDRHPWIVVFGHRPMYCSNLDHDDCKNHETLTRVGMPFFHWYGLEKLLYNYGVDLAIWAHEHSYERMWPVFDRGVYNGTTDPNNPYVNPKATVHVTSGSAGCREKTDLFENPPPWSAFRSSDYGYARLQVVNKTHLHWEQVSDDQGGKVIDEAWLVKEKHEKFS